jgi:hypothetical protein
MVKHGDVESVAKYSRTWFRSQPHAKFQARIFKLLAQGGGDMAESDVQECVQECQEITDVD